MQAAGFDMRSSLWSPCALDFIPDANYYRFVTPPPPPGAAEKPQGRDPQSRPWTATGPVYQARPEPPTGRAAPDAASDNVATQVKAGDRWVYRLRHGRGVVGEVAVEVLSVDGATVKERLTRPGMSEFSSEREVRLAFLPLAFAPRVALPGGYSLTELSPYFPTDRALHSAEIVGRPKGAVAVTLGGVQELTFRTRLIGKELVQVPAGRLEAWKVEATADAPFGLTRVRVRCTYWYSSTTPRVVKIELVQQAELSVYSGAETYELVEFTPGK
jgi:hypothetical protein